MSTKGKDREPIYIKDGIPDGLSKRLTQRRDRLELAYIERLMANPTSWIAQMELEGHKDFNPPKFWKKLKKRREELLRKEIELHWQMTKGDDKSE